MSPAIYRPTTVAQLFQLLEDFEIIEYEDTLPDNILELNSGKIKLSDCIGDESNRNSAISRLNKSFNAYLLSDILSGMNTKRSDIVINKESYRDGVTYSANGLFTHSKRNSKEDLDKVTLADNVLLINFAGLQDFANNFKNGFYTTHRNCILSIPKNIKITIYNSDLEYDRPNGDGPITQRKPLSIFKSSFYVINTTYNITKSSKVLMNATTA